VPTVTSAATGSGATVAPPRAALVPEPPGPDDDVAGSPVECAARDGHKYASPAIRMTAALAPIVESHRRLAGAGCPVATPAPAGAAGGDAYLRGSNFASAAISTEMSASQRA